jgi:ATP-dependent Clp protease ATP-binding subunit ClpB
LYKDLVGKVLKPALARGEIRCIGATTLGEYKKYFEEESAFARRFHRINIEEPDDDETLYILQNLANIYEKRYGITIQNSSLEAAIRLSNRYLSDQYLPDKAIKLIEEGSKRLQDYDSPPRELSSIQRKIKRLKVKKSRLTDDITRETSEEQSHLTERISELQDEYEVLKRRWVKVKEKLAKIRQLYTKKADLEQPIRDAEIRPDLELVAELKRQKRNFENQIQVLVKEVDPSETGFSWAKPWLDGEDIARLIEEQTGVPLTRITDEDRERLLQLENELKQRVIGQEEAITAVSSVIKRHHTGISDPEKPIGSFLFFGPTGVGKTELAKALAEAHSGSEDKLIQFDMSEFQEKHTVSRLLGAPPGYRGYDSGGQLTEKVRKQPFSVVLLALLSAKSTL